jgi:hypothetical protein
MLQPQDSELLDDLLDRAFAQRTAQSKQQRSSFKPTSLRTVSRA